MRRPVRLIAPGPTLAIGLAQVTGFMAFQTWALVEGGPGKTAVLVFTMPIWTLLIAWPVLGERIRGKQWLAALSTLTGLVLIIEPWNMHSSLFSKFLGLMAAMCWWLWITILDRVPAWEASLLVLGTPVVAIASSRLMLGEEFKIAELTGILLIGGGLALLSLIGWTASRRNSIK